MTRPTYDFEANKWVPQCPYGDVCSGCDAAGKCIRASLWEFLARMIFGRRVDPDSQRVVKFFPRLIPRKGEHVLVDGTRCRITFVRVGQFNEIGNGLYSYRIKSLRVKDDSQ